MLFKGFIPLQQAEQQAAKPLQQPLKSTPQPKLQTSRTDDITAALQANAAAREGAAPRQQQIVNAQKVGRNDACPCGSGKKFKSCHGKEES